LLLVVLVVVALSTANAQWRCLYATYDDATNGTGHNTVGVAVVGEDNFVALVWTPSTTDPRGARDFFVPYILADSANGRLFDPGYGSSATAGIYGLWDGGFDQVNFSNMYSIKGTPDGVIYGANNDANHNVLVFKFENNTVAAQSPYYRQETGANPISAVDVDGSGYVYVLNDTSTGVTDDIKIYPPIAQWTASHQDAPMQTVDLPDGIYKGIAVAPDGSALFVSDFTNRSIHKYVGTPATGYSVDLGFTFAMAPGDTVQDGTTQPAPLNLAFKSPENILFAAADLWITQEYSWGRIYLIHPATGALASTDSAVSVINVAQWNFDMTGAYNDRTGGTTPGNVSGYTSTFDVDFDANGNLYSQSHYGWTVEKWEYNGTLPTLSLTSVEPVQNATPDGYGLSANYPNPFNPSTTLEFSLSGTSPVVLEVFDALGRKVATLANGVYEAGVYKAHFDATGLPSGLYYARMTAGTSSFTQKMMLTK
jgi:hypothetical protein